MVKMNEGSKIYLLKCAELNEKTRKDMTNFWNEIPKQTKRNEDSLWMKSQINKKGN